MLSEKCSGVAFRQEEKKVFASKVAAARERAIEAAKAAAGAMKRATRLQ